MRFSGITFVTLLVAASATAPVISAPIIIWDVLDDGSGNGSNPGGAQPAGQNDTAGIFAAGALTGGFFSEPFPVNQNGSNFTSISATEVNSGIQMVVSEGTYDSANLGAALTVGDFTNGALSNIHSSSNLDYESSVVFGSNGTGQNAAKSAAWGVDTDSTISHLSNTVLLFDLTMGADANFFGVDILDLEGGNLASSYIGVYDSAGLLVSSMTLDWPSPKYGDNIEVFFGITDTSPLSYIAFFLGDDNGGAGYVERVAAADFYAGQMSVPELDRSFLFTIAMIAFGMSQKSYRRL